MGGEKHWGLFKGHQHHLFHHSFETDVGPLHVCLKSFSEYPETFFSLQLSYITGLLTASESDFTNAFVVVFKMPLAIWRTKNIGKLFYKDTDDHTGEKTEDSPYQYFKIFLKVWTLCWHKTGFQITQWVNICFQKGLVLFNPWQSAPIPKFMVLSINPYFATSLHIAYIHVHFKWKWALKLYALDALLPQTHCSPAFTAAPGRSSCCF